MSGESANWETVIGLEVHCQLATATKLFCGCANRFGAEPNSLTCEVCTGQPGALPVLNAQAVELALRAALALGAEIATESRFDRKHYFYCDLPKGYQITQLFHPYCRGGGIELANKKFVRLVRIHLEEDAGKALHDRGAETLVDLNRAGVPLIESVTEPDLSSAAEAVEYLTALREIVRFAGVSDGDMEKGSLRVDVNVSVRRPGEELRAKVELKNLNSFKNVQAAIEAEVARQIGLYAGGDPRAWPRQETRLFDAERGVTRLMRSKEDAADYRYFPDPDLVPLVLAPGALDAARRFLPELPRARRARYVHALGLTEYDAALLTAERDTADFFEAVARAAEPKLAANWVANDVLRALADPALGAKTIGELPLLPSDLASLLRLCAAGEITNSAARSVFARMLAGGGHPEALVAELGLRKVEDSGEIEEWCRAVLAEKPAVVAAVRAGNEKAIGPCVGLVLARSGGRADARAVSETLLRLIRAS